MEVIAKKKKEYRKIYHLDCNKVLKLLTENWRFYETNGENPKISKFQISVNHSKVFEIGSYFVCMLNLLIPIISNDPNDQVIWSTFKKS